MQENHTKNRIYKFRAWDKIDKAMYYDIQKGIKFTDLSHYTFNEFLGNPEGMGDYHEWIIMQYTGLKDSKGVEIYEGDIVKIKNTNSKTIKDLEWNQIIEWKDYRFIPFDNYPTKLMEVIGNIYENKNLIS